MKSRTAHSMEPSVSPVITAVGGASPYPVSPVSAITRTTTSSTASTVRRAVLKGWRRGREMRPV